MTTEAREILTRMRSEATLLRLRLLALAASGAIALGGSLVTAFGALGTAAIGARLLRPIAFGVTPAHVVFVLGLGMVIGAAITVAQLASANEVAGAAARLLDGSSRLRSSRVREMGSLCAIDLVFEDAHRAELLVSEADASALAAVLLSAKGESQPATERRGGSE